MSKRQQGVSVSNLCLQRHARHPGFWALVGLARAVNSTGKEDVTSNPRTVPSQGNAISPRDEEGRQGALGK